MKPPTNAWTSLTGSSPGHMLSGRRSHVSLKSKEAWFYEHLPVLTLATNLLTKKLATEPEFCFRRIITDVTVLAFSLNCICLEYIDWLDVYFPMRTYGYSRLYFGKENICLAVTFRNSKKAKLHLSTHNTKPNIWINYLTRPQIYSLNINTSFFILWDI